MTDAPLAGRSVLVTRPLERAGPLADGIRAAGGEAILFPCLEIAPRSAAAVARDAAALADADITVFVSSAAVTFGEPYASGRLAAVGPATAAALRDAGHDSIIVPADGYDSEALLALPEFADADGLRVRIIRGNGGRELLGRTLAARGAEVDYLETYARVQPDYSNTELDAIAQRFRKHAISAVVVMSIATLDNMDALLAARSGAAYFGTPLVSPAARVIQKAQTQNPDRPVELAAGPRVNDILDALARSQATADPD